MSRFVSAIIKYRIPILLLFLAASVLSAVSVSKAVINSNIENMLLGENPKYKRYLDLIRQFGNDQMVIIAFEEDRLFSRENLERLRVVKDELEDLQGVKRVRSILDLQDVDVSAGTTTYAEEALKHPESEKEILDKLRQDPIVGGLFISKDGRHSVVLIEMKGIGQSDAELAPVLIEMVYDIFERAGYDRSKLHRSGFIAMVAEVMKQTKFNINRLFPIVCVVLLGTVFLMFRRLWPVAITGIVSLLGVLWTMGLGIWIFGQVSVMIALIPPVVMIVSFSDVIHLCSSYLLELSQGESKDEAIIKSGSEVGKACVYTSLTTFFGFISISLVPTPMFRQMGFLLGVGVALSLFIALTLTPILFSIMPKPRPWRESGKSIVQGLLDWTIERIFRLTTSRPWAVVALFAIFVGLSVYGIGKMSFETNFVNRFSKNSRIYQDEVYFNEHFDGTSFIEVYLESPMPGGLMEPGAFRKIAAFQDAVLTIPEVDKALSLVDLVKIIHRQMAPDKAEANPLPDSAQAYKDYLLLFELSEGADLDQMISSDYGTMRMSLRINDDGVVAGNRVGGVIDEYAKKILGNSVRVEITGLTYIMGEWLGEMIAGQEKGLIFAFVTIFIMMAMALRSVDAAFWSMIPNAIPLLALGGYLGFFWVKVDSDVLALFMIAIGIAVDDTIHFLMRYRIELARTNDVQEALDCTFHYSGRAIIITTVILVAGFAPFAVSNYLSVRMMGTLLPGCLAVALAADLVLVPALVKLGAFRMMPRKKDADE